MPDFDPKTIPILDDVIEVIEPEGVKPEEIEQQNNDAEAEATADDEAIDNETALFTADPIIDFTTEVDDDHAESEFDINIEEQLEIPAAAFEDASENTPDDTSEESIESALIDYNAEYDNETSLEDAAANADEITSEIEEPEPATETQPLITAIELQTITDDVVNQLIPELEQRLRILVQQALEENLPTEIISSASSRNIDD